MRTENHNSFGRIKATLMLASAFSVAGASNAYSTIPEMSMGESTNIHAVDQKNIKIKGVIVDGSGTPNYWCQCHYRRYIGRFYHRHGR